MKFVEPTLWPDKYESRFYTADYSKVVEDPKEKRLGYMRAVLHLAERVKPPGKHMLMKKQD